MVIGNGLLASRFKSYENESVFFLASGLSDSKSSDKIEMDRELSMIEKCIKDNPNKLFIYFSTTSIYTKKTDYVNHKLRIEQFIINSGVNYKIFRLSQIVGIGGNKNNIFNFLKSKKIVDFIVMNTYRSFLDIDDLYNIVTTIISENNNNNNKHIYNLSGIEYLNMREIIKIFGIEGEYELVDSDETTFFENCSEVERAIQKLGIDRIEYTKKLIKKYK